MGASESAFCARGEEAFGFQLGFELFERQLQGAGAFGFDVLGRNLQLAAIFVNGDAAANDYLQAVGGTEAQQTRRRAEHHDANLGVAVFQGEIKMARIGSPEVGNFAFDPCVGIFAFDVRADGGHQIADFPDAAVGRPKAESHLVADRHEGSVPQEAGNGADGDRGTSIPWKITGERRRRQKPPWRYQPPGRVLCTIKIV